jgi:chitinase
MSVTTTVTLTSVLSVYTTSVANNQQQNNYQQVNAESTATPSSPSTAPIPSGTCTTGGTSCISGKYAVCNFDSWILFECPAGTVCSVENGSAMCDWPQQKRDLHHVHRVAPNVISV